LSKDGHRAHDTRASFVKHTFSVLLGASLNQK
jgi:hypothetical protein